jgi:glycosyltransferase involved in cell wall biosynthesis
MKFSLLIANYNNGHFFKDCYDSIIKQTYTDWEAIIVDDSSTDNSVEVIKGIIGDDSRFILVENEKNEGCGYTKRRCVELATGEWCGFLDPDDALTTDALKEISNKINNSSNSISGISSLFYYCDEFLDINQDKTDGSINYLIQARINNESRYHYNLDWQIAPFFAFDRIKYLMTSGINAWVKRAVDQDLYFKIMEVGDIVYLNKPLYLYRIHNRGISTNTNVNKAFTWHWKVIFDAAERRMDNNLIEDTATTKLIEPFFELPKVKEELWLMKKGFLSRIWRSIKLSLRK